MMNKIISNIMIFQITSFKKNHILIWNNSLHDLHVLITRFHHVML